MTPNTVFKQLEISLSAIQGLRDYCVRALKSADTGIAGLSRKDVPVNSIPWGDLPMGQDIEKWLLKTIPQGRGMLIAGPTGERFTIYNEPAGLRATRLTTLHHTEDGGSVEFFMSEESDGTQRFVDLLPAFYDLGNATTPRIFVIDEIDRSLHTTLTWNLISAFLQSISQASRSQLVFTAHDVMLIDQSLLRRDEIWFAEKDHRGSSKLVPLGQMRGVRADLVLRKRYLDGEFGGVPRIRELPHPTARVVASE